MSAPGGASLTPREQEVLRRMRLDRTYPEIAQELCISVETVRTHAARVRRKLGVRSKWQLVRQPGQEDLEPVLDGQGNP
jgi:DNA-binding CsgD family transcriptional regulator